MPSDKELTDELQRVIRKIQCSCREAEIQASNAQNASPSVFRPAVPFQQTPSNLDVLIKNLQGKCKEKDRLILVMLQELESRTDPETFNELVKSLANATSTEIDFDRTEICNSLRRPNCDPKFGRQSNQLKEPLGCQPCQHPNFPNCPCTDEYPSKRTPAGDLFNKSSVPTQKGVCPCSDPEFPYCPCSDFLSRCPLLDTLNLDPDDRPPNVSRCACTDNKSTPSNQLAILPTEAALPCNHPDFPFCESDINDTTNEASGPSDRPPIPCNYPDYPFCESGIKDTANEASRPSDRPPIPCNHPDFPFCVSAINDTTNDASGPSVRPPIEEITIHIQIVPASQIPDNYLECLTDSSQISTKACEEICQPRDLTGRTCMHANFPDCPCGEGDKNIGEAKKGGTPRVPVSCFPNCQSNDPSTGTCSCPCGVSEVSSQYESVTCKKSCLPVPPTESACIHPHFPDCPCYKPDEPPEAPSTYHDCNELPEPTECPCENKPGVSHHQDCTQPDDSCSPCETELLNQTMSRATAPTEAPCVYAPNLATPQKLTHDLDDSCFCPPAEELLLNKEPEMGGTCSSSVPKKKGEGECRHHPNRAEGHRQFTPHTPAFQPLLPHSDIKQPCSCVTRRTRLQEGSYSCTPFKYRYSAPGKKKCPVHSGGPKKGKQENSSKKPNENPTITKAQSSCNNQTCGASLGSPDVKSVSSTMNITEIRKVDLDGLLIKWTKADKKGITGYEIEVDGVLKSRVFCNRRTEAVLHSVAFKNAMNIAVYAINKDGRVGGPARAIFQP